jgi:hypothetical protein
MSSPQNPSTGEVPGLSPGPMSMERLNSECFCISLEPSALRQALASEVGEPGLFELIQQRCPYLFATRPVFLSHEHMLRMSRLVQAIESVVALPAYWDEIEKTENEYSFEDFDYMVNTASSRQANMIITLGRRQPRWPECHTPIWNDNKNNSESEAHILKLIKEVVIRYKDNTNILYWQVENEAFLGTFGVYFGLTKVIKFKKNSAFIASLFYLLSFGSVQNFWVPLETFSCFWGFFPILIFSLFDKSNITLKLNDQLEYSLAYFSLILGILFGLVKINLVELDKMDIDFRFN